MTTERTDIPPAEPLPGLTTAERLDKLVIHLKAIRENARIAEPIGTTGGPVYLVDPVAIEGWLAWSIAAADVLAGEARGDPPDAELLAAEAGDDALDPGGEHGGPAD